jgi:hypothetical protein
MVTAVRLERSDQQTQGGGLSSAVRADQPVNVAGLNHQVKILHGHDLTELLVQVAGFNQGHRKTPCTS